MQYLYYLYASVIFLLIIIYMYIKFTKYKME